MEYYKKLQSNEEIDKREAEVSGEKIKQRAEGQVMSGSTQLAFHAEP